MISLVMTSLLRFPLKNSYEFSVVTQFKNTRTRTRTQARICVRVQPQYPPSLTVGGGVAWGWGGRVGVVGGWGDAGWGYRAREIFRSHLLFTASTTILHIKKNSGRFITRNSSILSSINYGH